MQWHPTKLHLTFIDRFFNFHYSKKTAALIHSKRDEISSDLIGSFTVHVGDMDQCLHLWKYTGGFEKIDKAHRVLENDKVILAKIKPKGLYQPLHSEFL